MPTYVLLLTERLERGSLHGVDIAFASTIVALIAVTAIADQQQWSMSYPNNWQVYL